MPKAHGNGMAAMERHEWNGQSLIRPHCLGLTGMTDGQPAPIGSVAWQVYARGFEPAGWTGVLKTKAKAMAENWFGPWWEAWSTPHSCGAAGSM